MTDLEQNDETEAVLRASFKSILGPDYSDDLHLCRLAGMVERHLCEVKSVLEKIAKTGCHAGVCANSVDVCREMRQIAKQALEADLFNPYVRGSTMVEFQ